MARSWESIICYEDRGGRFTTSRWRLSGVRTKEASQNTADGVLWLKMSASGATVTVGLYKAGSCGSGDAVATGTADISLVDGDPANAAECLLSEANSSGLSGSLHVVRWAADGTAPVQVALCTDEDLDALWDGIEDLPGYDAADGCAEYIRVAQEDVLAAVLARYRDELGGHGAAEAWFIAEAGRVHPDLRRIANPGQLRLACAHRALAVAIGRSHQRGEATMYSTLRDYHNERFAEALASLVVAFKAGAGGGASADATAGVIRQARA